MVVSQARLAVFSVKGRHLAPRWSVPVLRAMLAHWPTRLPRQLHRRRRQLSLTSSSDVAGLSALDPGAPHLALEVMPQTHVQSVTEAEVSRMSQRVVGLAAPHAVEEH